MKGCKNLKDYNVQQKNQFNYYLCLKGMKDTNYLHKLCYCEQGDRYFMVPLHCSDSQENI